MLVRLEVAPAQHGEALRHELVALTGLQVLLQRRPERAAAVRDSARRDRRISSRLRRSLQPAEHAAALPAGPLGAALIACC